MGVIGFEALVRWEHPERGLMAPGEFMSIAEDTGMLEPIGAFVLEDALRQISRWRQTRPEITVSVNFTARQLEDARVAPTLARALQASGANPGSLCVEVSEAALAHNPDVAMRSLHALKALGVRLAIDDYGTGSSVLSNLRRLPLDTIKIHQSFVVALGGDPADTGVVGAMVELGHALGLSVVAEGVETDAQLVALKQLGCDRAQGFLFSPAVPREEADALLTAG